MGPQYKYDVTNDVIDDEGRAELYCHSAIAQPLFIYVISSYSISLI